MWSKLTNSEKLMKAYLHSVINHLVPLGQPLESRITSVVVKRLGSKDAKAVDLSVHPILGGMASVQPCLISRL